MRPRHVAMYLAKQLTSRSLPEIGRKFGKRDHTTVMYAIRRIEELRPKDAALDEDVEFLRQSLEDSIADGRRMLAVGCTVKACRQGAAP